MTASNDFDRVLAAWLETAGPSDMRPEATAAALTDARRVDQRDRLGAWLAGPSPWPRYGGHPTYAGLPRTLRTVIVVALVATLLATAVTAGALLLRILERQPAPVIVPTLVHIGAPGTRYDFHVDAITLQDGRILITGFGSEDGRLAEVLDPTTGQTVAIRPSADRILAQGAVPLPDGRVLLIGWRYAEPVSNGVSLAWALDPATLALTAVGPMTTDRFEFGIVALPDGRVVLAGGSPDQESREQLASVEIFDPATNTFAAAGSLAQSRSGHQLTLLADGRILVSGGYHLEFPVGQELVSDRNPGLEIYDPATGIARPVAQLSDRANAWAAPVLLPDGRVFIPGRTVTVRCGQHGVDPILAYAFDPVGARVTTLSDLPHDVRLAFGVHDGRILVAGSWDGSPSGCLSTFRDAWIGLYDPISGVTLESLNPMTGVSSLAIDTDAAYDAAALLPDGRIALVAGGSGSPEHETSVDILDLDPRQ
jgi:hypothetical protein